MRVFRWIVLLPVAVLAAYLAYFVGGVVNRIGFLFAYGIPPAGWVAGALDLLSHLYMGLGATYAAVHVAPGHSQGVAATTTAICLILGGVAFMASLNAKHYWGIVDSIGLVLGSALYTAALFQRRDNLTQSD